MVLFSQGAGGQDALRRIENSLDRKLARWAITEAEKRVILGRITFTLDLKELSKVDLLVEATIDHIYTKQSSCGPRSALPTRCGVRNTSSTLKLSDLARSITRSESLVGLHLIPPVPEVPVAELVRCHKTSDAAVEVVKGFERLGKEVIEINESIGLVNPALSCP